RLSLSPTQCLLEGGGGAFKFGQQVRGRHLGEIAGCSDFGALDGLAFRVVPKHGLNSRRELAVDRAAAQPRLIGWIIYHAGAELSSLACGPIASTDWPPCGIARLSGPESASTRHRLFPSCSL